MAQQDTATTGADPAREHANMELIKKMITDEKLVAIKSALEKDHAVLCLLLLNTGKGRWGDVKKYVRSHQGTISDGTFRSRMIEFESLGLAEGRRLDPLKKYYVKTKLGENVAQHLLQFFASINDVVEKANPPHIMARLR